MSRRLPCLDHAQGQGLGGPVCLGLAPHPLVCGEDDAGLRAVVIVYPDALPPAPRPLAAEEEMPRTPRPVIVVPAEEAEQGLHSCSCAAHAPQVRMSAHLALHPSLSLHSWQTKVPSSHAP